jgi:hypothetical protein
VQEQDDRQASCQGGGTVIIIIGHCTTGVCWGLQLVLVRHESQESESERSSDSERVGATHFEFV